FLCLAPEHKSDTVIAMAQKIFGEIQARAGKPLRAGEFIYIVNDGVICSRVLDVRELPHRRPKVGDLMDGPIVKFGAGLDLALMGAIDQVNEACDVGLSFSLIGRNPKRLSHESPPGWAKL